MNCFMQMTWQRLWKNWKKFHPLESSFERKGLKINLGKKKVIESGGGKRVVVLAKIDLRGVCVVKGLR